MKSPVVSLPWKRVAEAEVIAIRALRGGVIVDRGQMGWWLRVLVEW
jgi:hypothetical protein